MIIVFEGLDKLGKSTQAYMLADHLKRIGRKVKLYKQPSNKGDSFGSVMRAIIKDPDMNLCPVAEWACHLASHANQWFYSIMPAVNKGYDIILDRCWISAVVYQGYAKGLDPSLIIKAEALARNNIDPNEVFIFYSAKANPLDKPFEKDSMENQLKNEPFRRKVSEGYFQIAQEQGFCLIDVEQYKDNKQALHEFIKGIIECKLK